MRSITRFLTVCFLAMSCCRSAAELGDASERLRWEWTEFEQSGLNFLASKVKQDSEGYWVHRGNSFAVRCNVSGRLTAEMGRYVQHMVAMIPRVLGFPVLRSKQLLQVSVHRAESDFAAAGGERDGPLVFSRIVASEGGGVAELHICANGTTAGSESTELMDAVNLRLLQGEAMRALIKLSANGRKVSTFTSEGCAAYFESWDLREQMPRRVARMAGTTRSSRLQALQSAVIEKGLFCPSLVDAFVEPAETFFMNNAVLKATLAESFVDCLLSSQQMAGKLKSLLYHDPDGSSSWMTPLKTLLSVEKTWHDHICKILSMAVYVQKVDIPVRGTPAGNPSVTRLGRYGNTPQMIVCPGERDTYDIGWHEPSAGAIHVLKCGADNSKVGEITPEAAGETSALHGFCSIPGQDLFIAGHVKDNEFGNRNAEYWIAGFNGKGNTVFDTRIFGEKNSDEVKSKGYPGKAGSTRLAYNPRTKKVGVYTAHTMKWGDNVRHQAGYISLLSLSGENKTVSGWYVSHNFDQRMIVKDGEFYLLAHGDAYPRALVFNKRGADGGKGFSVQYHKIPGESGDNNTWCQTGGVVVMDDKRSAVVFASSNDRESHDVCIKTFDTTGKELESRWLTEYTPGTKGSYPRIASYGKGLLVAWEQSDGDGPVMQYVLLDGSLKTLQKQTPVADVHVSPWNDMVNLSGGSVVWAAAGVGDAIRVYRIDVQDKMYAHLKGVLAKKTAQTAKQSAVPKDGVEAKVDAALLKKLLKLSAESALPKQGVRLSKSKALIRLVGVEASGALEFEAGTGSSKRTATFSVGSLTLLDKAAIVSAVVSNEPDNEALCAVAGFYLQCAGQHDMARVFFAQAGTAQAQKFKGFFERE